MGGKGFGGSGGNFMINKEKEIRYLRDEVKDLKKENNYLREEINNLKKKKNI